MRSLYSCIVTEHDHRLILAAAIICAVGVYGSFAIALHAARSQARTRSAWVAISVVAAASTAWATHMVALLAFRPGMESAFDPALTAASLIAAIAGIGAGMLMAVGRRDRRRRALAGCTVGVGVALLHYLGQASYLVTGEVRWNVGMVAASIVAGLLLSTAAMVLAGERHSSPGAGGRPRCC